ncbi:MAG: hypothetical protein ACFHX7_15705 [Pseudomonadota bacterium]
MTDCASIKIDDKCCLKMSGFERDLANGYTATVEISSHGFSCVKQHFHFVELNRICLSLQKALEELQGVVTLADRYDRDEIRFRFGSLGHIRIEGELYEHSHLTQKLEFEFEADQTYLQEFARDLNAVDRRLGT